MPRESGWAAETEIGSPGALRALWLLYRALGRRLMLGLRWPVVLYFFLRSRSRRAASLQYLERIYASPEGRGAFSKPPGRRQVLNHFSEFGINLVDRMIVWAGGIDQIKVRYDGDEHLRPLVRDGKGAMLIGAHLGSFDMLRALATKYGFVVNVIMFTRHSRNINAFFAGLDPGSNLRVIHLDPDSVRVAFDIRACVERGELVAILSDRIDAGSRARRREVPFLGHPTRFPMAPYLIADTLGCPLLMVLCVRTHDSSYDAIVRPLLSSAPAGASRRERRQAADAALARFVHTIEEFCYRTPYQWFNFYDFWAQGNLSQSRAESPQP